ncbi:MAG: hypothetical protein ACOY90_07060 [Candidatus Zhuqueibacterota bacterium]
MGAAIEIQRDVSHIQVLMPGWLEHRRVTGVFLNVARQARSIRR